MTDADQLITDEEARRIERQCHELLDLQLQLCRQQRRRPVYQIVINGILALGQDSRAWIDLDRPT